MNLHAKQLTPPLHVAIRDANEADADAIVALAQALAKFEEVGDSAFTKEHFLRFGLGGNPSFRVIVAEIRDSGDMTPCDSPLAGESRSDSDAVGGVSDKLMPPHAVSVETAAPPQGGSVLSSSINHQPSTTNAIISPAASASHVSPREKREANENKVVGFLMYYTGFDLASASHGSHLADVFVDEMARGQGAGRALIRELARRTLDAEGEWVSWTVLKKNRAAKKFYTGLGASNVNVDFMAWGASALKRLAE